MNNKKIVSIDTADFTDCTNTGWTFTLYADGRVAAEGVSRWSGTRTGTRTGDRYTTEAGYIDLAEVGSGPDHDAEALLTAATRELDPREDSSFRRTRAGWIIR
jgi:hypothetical protein